MICRLDVELGGPRDQMFKFKERRATDSFFEAWKMHNESCLIDSLCLCSTTCITTYFHQASPPHTSAVSEEDSVYDLARKRKVADTDMESESTSDVQETGVESFPPSARASSVASVVTEPRTSSRYEDIRVPDPEKGISEFEEISVRGTSLFILTYYFLQILI